MTFSPLGSVTEFIRDGTHGSPVRTETGIPVLSAMNVKDGLLNFETNRYTSQDEFKAFNKRLPLATNDLLLTIVGTIGRAAVVNEIRPLVFQRSVAVIRPKLSALDSRFLFHVTQSGHFQRQLDRAANKSSQAGVYLGKLGEVEVPLPPLPEQRRIASILDQADALRAKRRKALAQLDSLTQSIFIEMFGDAKTNQKGWDLVRLADRFEFKNGINFSAEQKGRGTLTVDVSNMYSDDIYIRTERLYRVNIPISEDRLLVPGDLLFVRSSVKQEGVAWPALFAGLDEPVTYCGFLIRARPTGDISIFDKKFLVHYLRQASVRQQLISKSGKVAITNINQDRLGSLEIPIPPIALQEAFAERINVIETLRTKHLASLAQQNNLFSSLQHRAFHGEL